MASALHTWPCLVGRAYNQMCTKHLVNRNPSDLHYHVSAHFYPLDKSHSGWVAPSNHTHHPHQGLIQLSGGGCLGQWIVDRVHAEPPSGSQFGLGLGPNKHDRRHWPHPPP